MNILFTDLTGIGLQFIVYVFFYFVTIFIKQNINKRIQRLTDIIQILFTEFEIYRRE